MPRTKRKIDLIEQTNKENLETNMNLNEPKKKKRKLDTDITDKKVLKNVKTKTKLNKNSEQSSSESDFEITTEKKANKNDYSIDIPGEDSGSDESGSENFDKARKKLQKRQKNKKKVYFNPEPEEEYEKMTANQLKELCKEKGLILKGSKSFLIERLLNTQGCKKRKRKPISKSLVHKWLKEAGIKKPNKVNPCLKRAFQLGLYLVKGEIDLDLVILKSSCLMCSESLVITLRDCLYQETNGVGYGNDGDGAILCPNEDCEHRHMYISGICNFKPRIGSGKFHNHCTKCSGFGRCTNDWRDIHCKKCGKDYFAGSGGAFKCNCGNIDSSAEQEAIDMNYPDCGVRSKYNYGFGSDDGFF